MTLYFDKKNGYTFGWDNSGKLFYPNIQKKVYSKKKGLAARVL